MDEFIPLEANPDCICLDLIHEISRNVAFKKRGLLRKILSTLHTFFLRNVSILCRLFNKILTLFTKFQLQNKKNLLPVKFFFSLLFLPLSSFELYEQVAPRARERETVTHRSRCFQAPSSLKARNMETEGEKHILFICWHTQTALYSVPPSAPARLSKF